MGSPKVIYKELSGSLGLALAPVFERGSATNQKCNVSVEQGKLPACKNILEKTAYLNKHRTKVASSCAAKICNEHIID